MEYQEPSQRHSVVERLAPALDLAILVVFVVIGGQAHDLHSTTIWFFVVLWPLVAGWSVAALVFRAYGRGAGSWVHIALTWAVGMTVALLLRVVVTSRPTPPAFVVVLLVFTGVTMLGWRLAASIVGRPARLRESARRRE